MIIHIGSDVVIPAQSIIAVINLDSMEHSQSNAEFLKIAKEEGFVQDVFDNEKPKSMIIAEINGKSMIYLSPISSMTLARRVSLGEAMNIINADEEVK